MGSFWRSERGATMVEYALILLVVAMVVVGAALALGNASQGNYNDADTCIQAPSAANC